MDNFVSVFVGIIRDIAKCAWDIQLQLWDTIGFTSVFIQLAFVVLFVRFVISPALGGTSLDISSSERFEAKSRGRTDVKRKG